MLSRKPYYNTIGFQQHTPVYLKVTSKSIFPGVDMECKILRSINPVHKLLYESTEGQWFEVKTANIVTNTIEVITPERARNVTFEFNVVYAFLAMGIEDATISDKYYLYVMAKDSLDLEQVVMSGVYEDPWEVDPDMENYPLKYSDWATIREPVIQYIANHPPGDILNNSEDDRPQNSNPAPTQAPQPE